MPAKDQEMKKWIQILDATLHVQKNVSSTIQKVKKSTSDKGKGFKPVLCAKKRTKRTNLTKVGEQYFHESCYKCTVCEKPLVNGHFRSKAGDFYCPEDYASTFIKIVCVVCGV